MQPGKEILDELKGLSGYIASLNRVVPFATPEGYFDALPAAMTDGVAAANSNTDIALQVAGKQMPYQLPLGYFDMLPDAVLGMIAEDADVSFLPKAAAMTAPAGYFDKLPERMLAAVKQDEKPATKTIPLGNTLWKNLRWAAAALLIAGLGFGGYRMMQPADTVQPTASVEQRLARVPDATLNKYIQQNIDDFDGDMIAGYVAAGDGKTTITTDQLTDQEIINYLDETGWETSL